MAQTTPKAGTAKKDTVPPKTLKPSAKKAASKPAAEVAIEKPAKLKAAKTTTKASTAKAVAVEKVPVKKTATRSKAVALKGDGAAPVRARRSNPSPKIITSEQRYRMICEAAYYRAERRGFINGDPAQDWIDAEMEVDKLLSGI